MRIQIALSLATVVLLSAGCEAEKPSVPFERSEMSAYLDEHPELVISDEELNAQPVGQGDLMD
ncbi:hypothetical protein [Rhodopirellula sallentina]|uniref:Secreted protein n=1 Tax=Rhodopirellula sallentina SM41 TaxID=1263870 RepID=M5TS62_9BACT|nr:hypothetical protein [Rhodopirellula sallentina]EMI52027.1 secreted protein [Rhodopirellula sallentina SM41]